MAVNAGDFERFLYANYPDDYRRATVKDVPEDVLTAIISKHSVHYAKWRNIPEWIKNRYHDILPKEVLNGNEEVKDFILKEEQQVKKEEKDTSALIDFSVKLLAMGYAAEAVSILAHNRQRREVLLNKAQNGGLSERERKEWQELRKNDREAIVRDWQINQPEKYLLHLAKKMNRLQKNGKDFSALKQELRDYLPALNNSEAKAKMAAYLRDRPQQAAMARLSPEVMESFSACLLEMGIQIKPSLSTDRKNYALDRESLHRNLKENFNRRLMMEKLFREQIKLSGEDRDFQRVSIREVLNESVDRLNVLSLKGKTLQRA